MEVRRRLQFVNSPALPGRECKLQPISNALRRYRETRSRVRWVRTQNVFIMSRLTVAIRIKRSIDVAAEVIATPPVRHRPVSTILLPDRVGPAHRVGYH